MQELAMVVDLAREVGIVLLRRLENHLGAIRELMGGEVDLAKAAFANEFTKRVVADGVEVDGGELVQEGLVGVGELEVPSSVIHPLQGKGIGSGAVAPYCAVPVLHTRPAS
jgi:hypothetical protein